MGVLTNGLSRTFNGIETAETFITPALMGQNLFDAYRVMPNVVTKKQLNYRGRASKITRLMTACGFTAKGGVTLTDKTINVEPIEAQGKQCIADLRDTVYEELWSKKGNDNPDLTGTQIQTIVQDFIKEGVQRDNTRVAWFGVDGDDSADFNWFDGYWAKILDSSGDGGNLGFEYNMALQETAGALKTDAAQAIFKALYEGMPAYAWQLGVANFRFYVTHSLLMNWIDTLEGLGNDFGAQIEVNGVNMYKYRGIPIIPIAEWDTDLVDSTLPEGFSFNTASNNLCLLTIPDNLVLATDVVSAAQGVNAEIWYSLDNKELRYDVNYKFGCEIIHENLIAAAF